MFHFKIKNKEVSKESSLNEHEFAKEQSKIRYSYTLFTSKKRYFKLKFIRNIRK